MFGCKDQVPLPEPVTVLLGFGRWRLKRQILLNTFRRSPELLLVNELQKELLTSFLDLGIKIRGSTAACSLSSLLSSELEIAAWRKDFRGRTHPKTWPPTGEPAAWVPCAGCVCEPPIWLFHITAAHEVVKNIGMQCQKNSSPVHFASPEATLAIHFIPPLYNFIYDPW